MQHAGGDTYQSFRFAAQRWEPQQKMFQEFHTKNKKGISQVVDGAEWYDVSGDTEYHIEAIQGDRCGKCGSRKRSSEACQVDLWRKSSVSDARNLAMWASIVRRTVRVVKERRVFQKEFRRVTVLRKESQKVSHLKGLVQKGSPGKVLAKRENLTKFHGMTKIHGGMIVNGILMNMIGHGVLIK